MMSMAVLRRIVKDDSLSRIWQAARKAAPADSVCFVCNQRMVETSAPGLQPELKLDVCTRCQLIWLDAEELDRLPAAPPPPLKEEPMSPKSREALAMVQIQQLQERYEFEDRVDKVFGVDPIRVVSDGIGWKAAGPWGFLVLPFFRLLSWLGRWLRYRKDK